MPYRMRKSDGQAQTVRLFAAGDESGIFGRVAGAGDVGVCDPDAGRGADGYGGI